MPIGVVLLTDSIWPKPGDERFTVGLPSFTRFKTLNASMRSDTFALSVPGLCTVCYKGGTRFDLIRLRFEFTALDAIHFSEGKAANVLRGAFGLALEGDAYARIFAPARGESGPSGLADPPRPFVFRARHLDGATVPKGETFPFDLHLFIADPAAGDAIRRAFAEAARAGIGPGRGRAELRSAEAEPVSIDLAPPNAAPPRVRVAFLSPTELKHEGAIVQRPRFGILFARIRDRVSTLRELYGPGPLEIDFAAMGARAAAVQLTACGLRHVDVERRSSRTGQAHPIGGFTGWADYEGPLAEFLPFLEAARWTGVGRQAVWGKGEIYTQSTG